MSLSSVGAQSGASQMLVSLLSKLEASTTGTDSDTTTDDTAAAASPDTMKMQGPAKPSISSMVLGTLIAMQQDPSSGGATQTGDATDPVQSLFNSLDSDGDGTISQSELETSITALGGSTAQADSLFSALGGSDSSGLSESDLASAAPPPPPDGMGHGHRHGEHGMKAQNAYLSALGTLDGSGQDTSDVASA